METEVGTAVGAVLRALEWEQRMWRSRDSSECYREGSEVETDDVVMQGQQ